MGQPQDGVREHVPLKGHHARRKSTVDRARGTGHETHPGHPPPLARDAVKRVQDVRRGEARHARPVGVPLAVEQRLPQAIQAHLQECATQVRADHHIGSGGIHHRHVRDVARSQGLAMFGPHHCARGTGTHHVRFNGKIDRGCHRASIIRPANQQQEEH